MRCAICKVQFIAASSTTKTCSPDCSDEWKRKLSRDWARRNFQPKPPRPDVKCESCGTWVTPARSGPTPRWCSDCRTYKADRQVRKDAAVPRCHKCRAPVPDAVRKPGKTVCDDCRVDPRKNREAHEFRRRLRRYGLTPEAYKELVAAHDGRCRICRTDDPGPKGWCIDHCHKSGRVRALLCSRCNTALGWADEDPVLLRALADFAEEWQQVLASEMKI